MERPRIAGVSGAALPWSTGCHGNGFGQQGARIAVVNVGVKTLPKTKACGNRTLLFAGDVASTYISYLKVILALEPCTKFIILERQKTKVVESFLRKTSADHWREKNLDCENSINGSTPDCPTHYKAPPILTGIQIPFSKLREPGRKELKDTGMSIMTYQHRYWQTFRKISYLLNHLIYSTIGKPKQKYWNLLV
ncbi:hypothetical protein CYMTET_25669 [Cymbomonas tetramitiformis]|uniref:Uncharacterized protein n=1 Tax=Cymbomonas tetramitiformis TaxID=36881 RepID=A0AAE0KYY5_9CHLO|nr:hypothetical protein CYMTET_25669 [Cymbomonas tetramitiformis]